MQIEQIPTNKLIPYARNAKQHPDAQVALGFKTIPIYPNYEVNGYSHIRSKRHKKILSSKKKRFGYSQVGLLYKGKYHWHHNHRLCAMAWCGLPDNYKDLVVAHNDGDKTNNYYKNIRWTTQKDNCRDRKIHGNDKGAYPGERHHNAKLTSSIVAEIRDRVRAGERFMAVIKDLGVKKLTAYDAVIGTTWRSVNETSKPVKLKG